MRWQTVLFLLVFTVAVVWGLMQAKKYGFKDDKPEDTTWMVDDGASFDTHEEGR